MSTRASTVVPTDEQLMQAVADGDTGAIRTLYDRHARLVYSQARRICVSEGLAEEVVQEVFLAVWRAPGRFDTSRRFTPWLLTVAHHKAVDAVRRETTAKRRAVSVSVSDEYLDLCIPAGPGADEAVLSSMAGDHVRAALTKLPVEQRSAIALAYYGGFTQREVASMTGVPLGTVKSRMFNGILLLRRLLAPLMPDMPGGRPLLAS